MENIKLVPENQIGALPSTHGTDYETKVTLFAALTASIIFDEFDIYTNVKDFEPLDDIFLKGYKNGEEIVYLIQLKHNLKSKKLADSFFIKGYNPNSKAEKKPKFDLSRYNDKYIELSETLGVNNINFIFYTNYELDVKSAMFIINDGDVESEFVKSLNTSVKQQSSKLNKNNDQLMSLHELFINNTSFLTNQLNVTNINNSIIKLLTNELQISEDLSHLIIGNLFNYFNNICSETEAKPVITKHLTLKLLFFTCFYSRNIPILKVTSINDYFVYSPNLWDYLKKSKVIIKKQHVENIQNMIFNHDDSIHTDNPTFLNILFKNKYEFNEIIKKYFVQCCCGLLPFLIDAQYFQEIINIMDIFDNFEVIFIDDSNDKYKESKFRSVSLELCDEIFSIKIRPMNRNECYIKDVFSNKDELKSMLLNNVNVSDFLQICERDEFKESVELERFVYRLKIENSLNDLIDYDVVVLINYNYSKADLINYHGLNISEDLINYVHETLKIMPNSRIIVLNDMRYNKINVNLIKDRYKNQNIHLLNVGENGSLFWVNSFGSLGNIKFAETNNDTIKLKQIHNFYKCNQLIVFSGLPGIGKSVAMNQLSTFIPPNFHVLLIKLTEKQDILNNLTDNNINVFEVLKLLYNEVNTFYSSIFELKFKKRDLFVIFDGYDEIAPKFVKAINNLIHCILKEEIQVILTSRSVLQAQIEKEFSTKSFTLKPFDLQEQTQYLERYFSQNTKYNEYYIRNICADIVNKIKNNLIGDVEFNSVPLHLKIIAELLLDLFKQNNFDVVDIEIDKLKIYEIYIDKKLTVFKEKAKNLNFDEDEIMKYHQTFALKKLFPQFIDSLLEEYLNVFSQRIRKGSEKTGFLVDDVNEIFIHRTIAEYFTASWLVNNCENNNSCKKLIMDEIFKKEYYFVNSCFNSLLYNKTSVWNKIISNKFNRITSVEINQQYVLNRNILHLLFLNFDANTKSKVISSNLEEFFKANNFEIINFNTQKDHFQLTPFDYSKKVVEINKLIIRIKVLKNNLYFYFNQNFTFLEFINCRNIKTNSFFKFKFKNGFDLFMFAINGVNLSKFNFVFLMENFDEENNVRLFEDYKIGFEWLVELGETINALHYKAMNINSTQLSNFLLEKYGSKDFFANIDENPLSHAFLHNLIDFIILFMENKAVTKNNSTNIVYILNKFIKDIIINNNEQLLNYLSINDFNINELKIYNKLRKFPEILNLYKNILIEVRNDKLGNTAVHLIISSNNSSNLLKLLDCVIDTQNNINTENNNGATPLHLAIRNTNLEIIKILIKFKVDVNFTNNLQDPYLLYSISSNNLEITKLLLENETNVEVVDINGDTPLIHAVKNENLEMVKILLNYNANINVGNNLQKNPLHWAVSKKDLQITQLLLENNADIEATDINGNTPLISAVINENLNAVKILINIGSKINANNKKQETPLHWSVSKKELKITKILLKNKAHIEVVDTQGYTPLIWAVIHNELDAVKILLENGANIEAVDIYGSTPLLWAIRNQNLDAVKFLLQNEANIEAFDNHGNTPLISAVRNKNLDAIKYLLEKKAHIEAVDYKGNTPLICAVRNENLDAVKVLTNFGAKINTTDNYQSSPLCLAAQFNKQAGIARMLLEKGADIENVDLFGNTPLLCAIIGQNFQILKLLIQFGAKINVRTKHQLKTSLHLAVEKDLVEIVKILLEHNTELNVVDQNGETPLSLALRNGNNEVIQLLDKDKKKPIATTLLNIFSKNKK